MTFRYVNKIWTWRCTFRYVNKIRLGDDFQIRKQNSTWNDFQIRKQNSTWR